MNETFWNDRYKSGGNSGLGSYGKCANGKASVINNYIKKYNIKTISDFGCGDGNQISLLEGYENYCGYDISPYIIDACKNKFENNKFMTFTNNVNEIPNAELTLSLDVLYHLVNICDFELYLSQLFDKSKKYVLIFSSNHDRNSGINHIYHRKFTDWVDKHHTKFKLIEEINNFYDTSAQFYLYKNI